MQNLQCACGNKTLFNIPDPKVNEKAKIYCAICGKEINIKKIKEKAPQKEKRNSLFNQHIVIDRERAINEAKGFEERSITFLCDSFTDRAHITCIRVFSYKRVSKYTF